MSTGNQPDYTTAPIHTYPAAPSPGTPGIGLGPLLKPSSGAGAPVPLQAHHALLLLGAEVLGIAALATIADQDPRWATVVLTLLAVLWLGWLFNHANQLSGWFAKLGA